MVPQHCCMQYCDYYEQKKTSVHAHHQWITWYNYNKWQSVSLMAQNWEVLHEFPCHISGAWKARWDLPLCYCEGLVLVCQMIVKGNDSGLHSYSKSLHRCITVSMISQRMLRTCGSLYLQLKKMCGWLLDAHKVLVDNYIILKGPRPG